MDVKLLNFEWNFESLPKAHIEFFEDLDIYTFPKIILSFEIPARRFYGLPPTTYDTLTSLDFFMGHIQRRIYSWCRCSSEDSFANKQCT